MSDRSPGIRRRRSGNGFVYRHPSGRPLRDRAKLARIQSLAIPPAWTDVWICTQANGHLQAVGRDARGRKQYRYHPDWQAFRDRTKYDRMLAFAAALPTIRRRVRRDLARPGLPREKVLATVVRLLELTQLRIGNAEYTRQNRSYGLTTLRSRHVRVRGSRLRFRFRGKSGQALDVAIANPRLARIVRRCQEIPGQELFQYLDERGEVGSVNSGDVNRYLGEVSAGDFTAKDFRTWAGSVLACAALGRCEPAHSASEAKRNVVQAVAEVAARLGNTAAVCRKAYVHPQLIEGYLEKRKLVTHRRTRPAPGLNEFETVFAAALRHSARSPSKD